MHHNRQENQVKSWKDLYLAALFERDKARIPQKIAEARSAIATRRTTLLNMPGIDIQERQALDNALFSLQALRNCLVVAVSAAA